MHRLLFIRLPVFFAMSCKAMRIKLLRRPVGLAITPRFPCKDLLSTTDDFGLHFWNFGSVDPQIIRIGLNKGNQGFT
jgi:hypothetical protein